MPQRPGLGALTEGRPYPKEAGVLDPKGPAGASGHRKTRETTAQWRPMVCPTLRQLGMVVLTISVGR